MRNYWKDGRFPMINISLTWGNWSTAWSEEG